LAANALAQAADHIDSFFKLLQIEMAFYVACINLHERLDLIGESTCWPSPSPRGAGIYSFEALSDVSLSLFNNKKSVSNDLRADGKDLIVITGANQGGKSTFLRSLGLAQLLMQCGMFVPAKSFAADMCQGVFTHHRRKEDRDMKSGKFDEELSRMSAVADQIKPYSLILFNESFAATNEREGSEIARQIVTALIENGIKVVFVTHLYTFAREFQERAKDRVLLLRAERHKDGVRTFKIIEGPPSERCFGEELYYKIFPDS
ncbi:MAG TPA: DNA mismatch repair protein MutS, partial [Rectinemataceae bacterium]